ncbi:hypothetical protein B8V81_2679 [Paenibacillus pasadenensis]|uniref:MOSC domain-containing protein n=1 Tax=Paenibacillus pasadenensis TaxID=217090 RepID=A0A2N5N1N6_9BACL|nr:MOSC N-terminal beta barrel domain-containing protein [Paenibacillus pasadenensis]PLT44248.1 hypothetical protein B8V81_2679 [Paenibacillus pasadenensis]
MRIGQTSEIWRYPVKSMGGERLQGVSVERYGLEGDRFCSLYDEAKEGWSSYHTARKFPALLMYRAAYGEKGVRVDSPLGPSYRWESALGDELEQVTGTRMSMSAEGAPGREGNGLMAVDAASVLIVTDASLRRLKAAWGKEAEALRFRPNLLLRTDDPELDDESLLGARLRIGGALLQVDSFCQRCSMVNYDPDSLERDPSLLRVVNDRFGLSFGLYASILEPGRIAEGDAALLEG